MTDRKKNAIRCGIRFRHCRGRFRRLRLGEPAVGRSGDAGAGDRGRRQGHQPWIHIPAGFYRNIYNPGITWQFETEPVPGLGGRRVSWPRGKVLGGSSSINGLIYIRGQPAGFDYWRQLGNVGWSYDDVLPYFRRTENQERGGDDYHGAGGPLDISDLRAPHELHDAFTAGCQEAGFEANPDFKRRRAGRRRQLPSDRARDAAVAARRSPICARR